MRFWKTLVVLSKTELNRQLIYNKSNTKEAFHFICKRLILIDSVYKKHYIHYPKKFLGIYSFNKDT